MAIEWSRGATRGQVPRPPRAKDLENAVGASLSRVVQRPSQLTSYGRIICGCAGTPVFRRLHDTNGDFPRERGVPLFFAALKSLESLAPSRFTMRPSVLWTSRVSGAISDESRPAPRRVAPCSRVGNQVRGHSDRNGRTGRLHRGSDKYPGRACTLLRGEFRRKDEVPAFLLKSLQSFVDTGDPTVLGGLEVSSTPPSGVTFLDPPQSPQRQRVSIGRDASVGDRIEQAGLTDLRSDQLRITKYLLGRDYEAIRVAELDSTDDEFFL